MFFLFFFVFVFLFLFILFYFPGFILSVYCSVYVV